MRGNTFICFACPTCRRFTPAHAGNTIASLPEFIVWDHPCTCKLLSEFVGLSQGGITPHMRGCYAIPSAGFRDHPHAGNTERLSHVGNTT